MARDSLASDTGRAHGSSGLRQESTHLGTITVINFIDAWPPLCVNAVHADARNNHHVIDIT
jgi:hypothetical protein